MPETVVKPRCIYYTFVADVSDEKLFPIIEGWSKRCVGIGRSIRDPVPRDPHSRMWSHGVSQLCGLARVTRHFIGRSD